MSFAVNYTISQTANGKILTFRDTSNYGDGSNDHKSNFTSRTLYLTFADDLIEQAIPFPFTNTNDSIQDIITYSISRDVALVAKLELVHPSPDPDAILFSENSVATTEFIEGYLRRLLGNFDFCGCVTNRTFIDLALLFIGKTAALNRADRGDIVGSQKALDFVQEKAQILIG